MTDTNLLNVNDVVMASAALVYHSVQPLLRPDIGNYRFCPSYELPRYHTEDALDASAAAMGIAVDPVGGRDLELPNLDGLRKSAQQAYGYINYIWRVVGDIKPSVSGIAHFKISGFEDEPGIQLIEKLSLAQAKGDYDFLKDDSGARTNAVVQVNQHFTIKRRERLLKQKVFRLKRAAINDGNVVLIFSDKLIGNVLCAARVHSEKTGGLYSPFVFLVYDHGKFTLETGFSHLDTDCKIKPAAANMDEFPDWSPRTVIYKFLIPELDAAQSGPGGDARHLAIRIKNRNMQMHFVTDAEAADICNSMESFTGKEEFNRGLITELYKLRNIRNRP